MVVWAANYKQRFLSIPSREITYRIKWKGYSRYLVVSGRIASHLGWTFH